MRKNAKCGALGLAVAIGAGSLAVARPANADVFWNLKAEQEDINGNVAICMGIAGGDPGGHVNVGTSIIVWNCNISNDQVWNQVSVSITASELQDFATDPSGNSICLNDKGGTNDRGTQLNVADCNGGTAEQFIFSFVQADAWGDPCFTIQAASSRRFVGVANAQVNPVQPGMSVVMWDRTSSNDQVWCRHPDPVVPIQ